MLGPSTCSGPGLHVARTDLVGDELRPLTQSHGIAASTDQDERQTRWRHHPGGQVLEHTGSSRGTRHERLQKCGGAVRCRKPDRALGRGPRQGTVSFRKTVDPHNDPLGVDLNQTGLTGGRPVSLHHTLKPRARSCSRPSSVILSGPHGGIQTQLIRWLATRPSRAWATWSSMTSVSGQAALVKVMSMMTWECWSTVRP